VSPTFSTASSKKKVLVKKRAQAGTPPGHTAEDLTENQHICYSMSAERRRDLRF